MNGVGSSPFHDANASVPIRPRFKDELADGEPEGNPCGLGLDIDEAAHAGFAITKNGGFGAFRDHANQQVNLAMNHHLAGSLAFEPLIKGSAGFCGAFAGAAVVGPAAGFAMHAGWHEWSESASHAKIYAERERNLLDEAALTHKLSPKTRQELSGLAAAFDSAAALRIAYNQRFAIASKTGGLIGKYSFLSGAAIMARIAVELVRNVGGAVASGTTHVATAAASGALAPSFLMSTGLASNALATLASGCAVMLGVNFVRKTGATKKHWQEDQVRLAHTRYMLQDSESAYGKFLTEKSKHRVQFVDGFHSKNRLFLAGTALYAAGTLLPNCVKMLAAAGILSSKKVGSKLILAMLSTGIAGALAMGVFSHQFFYGHPNLERYEQYELKDTELLDRRFLTNIDTFVFQDRDGNGLDSRYAVGKGLEMRESFFHMLKKHEQARQSLLQHLAQATGRTFSHISHKGDTDYDEHRPFVTKVKTVLNRKKLRTKDVEQWLRSADHKKHLLQCFGEMFSSKIEYLEKKAALHKRMDDQVMKGADTLKEMQERRQYGQSIFGSYEHTVALLAAHRDLAQKIAVAQSPVDVNNALKEVLALQGTEDHKPDEKHSLEQRLARHVLRSMPAQYNHDRGMLLEVERQAGKNTTAEPHMKKPIFER